jgi:hypothetical protein
VKERRGETWYSPGPRLVAVTDKVAEMPFRMFWTVRIFEATISSSDCKRVFPDPTMPPAVEVVAPAMTLVASRRAVAMAARLAFAAAVMAADAPTLPFAAVIAESAHD